ncbi:MAG TPA: hypothetical protein VII37_02200 [Candidatus Acidoferrum sp.]
MTVKFVRERPHVGGDKHDQNWGTDMGKLANTLLAWLIAIMFVAAPVAALARPKDNPNYGFCKSGKQVTDIKKCKENGGKL